MSKCCSENGCNQSSIARGFCANHYAKRKRAGLLENIATPRGLPVEQRFWKYVLKTDDCWLWTGGSINQKGYGRLQLTGKREHVLVHRLSYEMHHGPIPSGMVVMHTCDNPSCVNPGHLRVGTQSENILESFKKGRKVCIPPLNYGESHRSAVLNEDIVRLIRLSDEKTTHLANRYGVSRSTVQRVRERKTWAHIP